MIPISFWWNARKRSASFKLDGFVSAEWEKEEITTKILKMPVPFFVKKETGRLFGFPPVRWTYLKGGFSFFTEWKMKKVEGTFSLPDPMVNGILYGWMSAVQIKRPDRKIDITVNFLGENWVKGEFTVSLKTLLHHFRSWIYPLISEMRERKVSKGGK